GKIPARAGPPEASPEVGCTLWESCGSATERFCHRLTIAADCKAVRRAQRLARGEEGYINSNQRLRQEEFERVAMVHTASLLRTAARLSLDAAAAEDLVQEALLRAWRAFDQFEPGTNCKAWLFRIMLNLSSRGQKTVREAPQVISLDGQPEWNELAVQYEHDPFKHADLNEALAAMHAEHREAIQLA